MRARATVVLKDTMKKYDIRRIHGLEAVKPLSYLRFMGFYNPFALVYKAFSRLTQFVLGKQRRNNILRKLHWETLWEFLDWMCLPEGLSESFIVKGVETQRFESIVSSFLINKHGHFFIDVGADIGYYSFLLYNNFDTILAVEPHPVGIRMIERVKEKYGYNKVNILSTAISDKDGKAKLYFCSHYGAPSLVPKPKSNYLNVNTITLDSLLKTYGDVDLIKIDVEGAEWKILNGAKSVMGKIKSWLIELHDITRKNELEDLLKFYGYNVMWVDWKHIYAER